jgi:hypothetical protein
MGSRYNDAIHFDDLINFHFRPALMLCFIVILISFLLIYFNNLLSATLLHINSVLILENEVYL